MYYDKLYWKYILKLYRFDTINTKQLEQLNKIPSCKIPLIFKNLENIVIYNGKINIVKPLKFTNINNK